MRGGVIKRKDDTRGGALEIDNKLNTNDVWRGSELDTHVEGEWKHKGW